MTDIDPPIIDSPLSQVVTVDGVTVQVRIFKLEADDGWTLKWSMKPEPRPCGKTRSPPTSMPSKPSSARGRGHRDLP